jgi:hypothetical protein
MSDSDQATSIHPHKAKYAQGHKQDLCVISSDQVHAAEPQLKTTTKCPTSTQNVPKFSFSFLIDEAQERARSRTQRCYQCGTNIIAWGFRLAQVAAQESVDGFMASLLALWLEAFFI